MTLRAAVLLAALHLDDENFFAAALADNLAFNFCSREIRTPEPNLGILAARFGTHKHLAELHRGADVAFKLLKLNNIARLYPVLFTTRHHHCVHRRGKLPELGGYVKVISRESGI